MYIKNFLLIIVFCIFVVFCIEGDENVIGNSMDYKE